MQDGEAVEEIVTPDESEIVLPDADEEPPALLEEIAPGESIADYYVEIPVDALGAKHGVSLYYQGWRRRSILKALEQGNTRRASAAAGGINAATLGKWMQRHEEFATRVEVAEQRAVRNHLANINRAAAKGNWLPSAWFLERRYPQDFGRVDRGVMIIRQQQAKELADELRAEGYEITEMEVLREYDQLSKRSLPPGAKSNG